MARGLLNPGIMKLAITGIALLVLFAAMPAWAENDAYSGHEIRDKDGKIIWPVFSTSTAETSRSAVTRDMGGGYTKAGIAVASTAVLPTVLGSVMLGLSIPACPDAEDIGAGLSCAMGRATGFVLGGGLLGVGILGGATGAALLVIGGQKSGAKGGDATVSFSPWLVPHVTANNGANGAVLGVSGTF